MSVYRRALAYFRPFLGQSVFAALLSLFGIGLNLLKPWPFKIIVDGILTPVAAGKPPRPLFGMDFSGTGQTSPSAMILILCAFIVVIHLLSGGAAWLTSVMFIRIGLRALLKVRTELYACLQSLPLKFHDARRSTDSSFRVAYDSQSIQAIYNKGFATIFNSGITLLATLAVMARMDWRLTLMALAVVPCILGALRFFAKRIRDESTAIQERDSDLLTAVQEGLGAVRAVRAFGREQFEVDQFRRQAERSLEANLRFNATSLGSNFVIGALMALSTAALYGLGSLHVLDHSLSLGSLLVFASYLVMLYQPLEQLTYTAWALEGATAGAKRCFEVLDHADDVSDAPDAREIAGTRGEIRFENVGFSYDPARLILENVSVGVEPGETVAFVGGTGAGKSTLLSLVPRFYDPVAGRVVLDGNDVRSLTKKSLRNQISIVLQDTLLFSTTIRENIAYGRSDATEAEIVEAAKRAQAHEFIMALPDGYSSQVGERGGHLSVGQRQRLGIARAFLKNAPILLLDEPTSALDPTTEAAIMETIQELMRGRTTLIVTHRIATIHGVDKIVVLKDAGIAEIGSGAELLARGGAYAALYRSANIGR